MTVLFSIAIVPLPISLVLAFSLFTGFILTWHTSHSVTFIAYLVSPPARLE